MPILFNALCTEENIALLSRLNSVKTDYRYLIFMFKPSLQHEATLTTNTKMELLDKVRAKILCEQA
ncbi:hypothetical protein C8R27_1257 [Nitrosomonas ureae]|nr:hypothetical protein C8R27_1257 [Nitrosomonas ureae]